MPDQLRDITKSKYLSAFASWSSALDAIGTSEPTVLRVNESPTISSSRTLPKNVHLQFEGQSVLNINSGVVVNGPIPQEMPRRQLFDGEGQYRILENDRAARDLFAIWWLPDAVATHHVITTAQRTAMQLSQMGNYGSRLIFPQGKFQTAEPFEILRGSIEGHYAHPQPDGALGPFLGTILEITTSGKSPIRVLQGARMVKIRNITLYGQDETGANPIENGQAVLMQGAMGEANIVSVEFDNVVTFGFEDAIKCHSTSGDYEFDDIVVRSNCHLLNYSRSGFYVNSVNGKYKVPSNIFIGKRNGESYHLYLYRMGTMHTGGHARGTHTDAIAPVNTHRETIQKLLEPEAFDTETGLIEWPNHGLQNGDSLKVNRESDGDEYAPSDTDMPVLSDVYGTISLANGEKVYAINEDTNHIRLARHPDAARSGVAFEIDAAPGESIKLWSERPNPTVADQRQRGFIYLGSVATTGGLHIDDYQDEGLPEFIRVANPQGFPVNAASNYYPPITINGAYSVGQMFLERGCEIVMDGCSIPPDSIHDEYDVKARIRMRSCVPVHHGIAGPMYTRSGFFPPEPANFGDFKGGSMIITEDNLDKGLILRGGNDVPLQTWELSNNAAPFRVARIRQRIGSGVKAAFWTIKNLYSTKIRPESHGGSDRLAGEGVESHFFYEGALLNAKKPTAVEIASGELYLDLSKNDRFILDGPDANAALKVLNPWVNPEDPEDVNDVHTQRVTLFIKTANTTSRDLTGSTDVILSGTFATGTTADAYYAIFFDYEPLNRKLIEVARSKFSAGIADPLSVKNLTILPDTGSSIEFLGRDESGNIFLYSPTQNTLIVYTGSGIAQFVIDGNTTANQTGLMTSIAGGEPVRISVGANDSAGSGFRTLRVPNSV